MLPKAPPKPTQPPLYLSQTPIQKFGRSKIILPKAPNQASIYTLNNR